VCFFFSFFISGCFESTVSIFTVGICKIQFRNHNTGHEFKCFGFLDSHYEHIKPQVLGLMQSYSLSGVLVLVAPSQRMSPLDDAYCQVQLKIKVFSEECRKRGETLSLLFGFASV